MGGSLALGDELLRVLCQMDTLPELSSPAQHVSSPFGQVDLLARVLEARIKQDDGSIVIPVPDTAPHSLVQGPKGSLCVPFIA